MYNNWITYILIIKSSEQDDLEVYLRSDFQREARVFRKSYLLQEASIGGNDTFDLKTKHLCYIKKHMLLIYCVSLYKF